MSNELEVTKQAIVEQDTSAAGLMFTPGAMQQLVAVADFMAKGRATVPKHLQGNQGDCLAVVMQATTWRMNPFAVAQKTHLVNGVLGYEAQLVNAVVNTMAPTKDRINYEWFGEWTRVMGKFEERESKKKVDEDTGKPLKYRVPNWNIKDEDGLGIRVWATMKGEAEPRVLELLLVQCRVRNSPLWADDPRQQIAYLAVKRWTRLHCPDVLLGVYTPDELDDAPVPKDMGAADVVGKPVDPKNPPGLSDAELAAWRREATKGLAAAEAHWKAMGRELRMKATMDQQVEMRRLAEEADKKRTVDNGAAETKTAQPATNAPAATVAAKADPATGEVDPDFVAAMDRAEQAAGAKA
jgi:hypothetical protein